MLRRICEVPIQPEKHALHRVDYTALTQNQHDLWIIHIQVLSALTYLDRYAGIDGLSELSKVRTY